MVRPIKISQYTKYKTCENHEYYHISSLFSELVYLLQILSDPEYQEHIENDAYILDQGECALFSKNRPHICDIAKFHWSRAHHFAFFNNRDFIE